MKTKLLTLLALHLGLAAMVAQPVVTNQPTWQTNFVGGTATFSVGATGATPLLYQWRKSASSLPGQTNSTLVFTNLQLSQQAMYSVVVSDVEGSVTSSVVRLYAVVPPTIAPANPTASLFADLTLYATNSSGAALAYQWLLAGEPIAGAVMNKLVLTNVQKTDAGNYALVATYAFGSSTSQVATLKITPFNSIYWFDFSWTDTHNCVWLPATNYYQGRVCNGPMWCEFISTNLGLPYIEANNYSFCGSGPEDMLPIVRQFSMPSKPALSLYCRMADYDEAPPAAMNLANWPSIIRSQVLNESNVIQTLYSRGARHFLINEVFDVSKLRIQFDESTNFPSIALYGEFKRQLNDAYFEVMNSFSRSKPDVRIVWVEIFEKLNDVIGNPARYGFTETRIDALNDLTLTDKSFSGPGANYVFWNNAHATTKVHRLITGWALDALTNAAPESLEAISYATGLRVQMNHLLIGREYTLQLSTDLGQWNDVQTFTASAGTNHVSQPLEIGTRSAFYRIRWQQ